MSSTPAPELPARPAGDGPADEVLPVWDAPEALPVAVPVAPDADLPVALPVEAAAADGQPAPAAAACPVCGSEVGAGQLWCGDCGYHLSPADLARAAGPAPPPAAPAERLQGRFELGEVIGERKGVVRFRAVDHGDSARPAAPVVVVRQALPPAAVPAEAEPAPAPAAEDIGDEILPGFDEVPSATPVTEVIPGPPPWPGIAWERAVLRTVDHAALPAEVAHFSDDAYEYLVEEVPAGRSLWDAWDDPDATSAQRFGWLAEVAEALQRLHQGNVMFEGLRPDVVVVDAQGHARLNDLGDLLPLPLPADAPVCGRLYTAPEVMSGQGQADARADLYSFGAMLYALHVGRELTEVDFDRPGHPKPFIPRFPDVHPTFGRLLMKTFRREVEARFPTDEAGREDPTGFTELIRTLGALRRTYDHVRLEVASWTTTGIVRTGNEDAYALLHATESRQDDLGEAALVLLCDGMGGYEAGEVAAALAIQVLRQELLKHKPFAALAGSPFVTDPLAQMSRPEGHGPEPLDVEDAKRKIMDAIREANKQVFQASRAPGAKRRGMGCTAEVVYVDGNNVVVGHVGDSRTYHLHEGRILQLTRDQTLVNRLVELGTLSAEEAETHPRRNELQQAVGGQPNVEPGLYHGALRPGDWVVVCSDGLSNHVNAQDLRHMLLSEATSAEMAARRLINLTNIEGATDNATVVVIRAT